MLIVVCHYVVKGCDIRDALGLVGKVPGSVKSYPQSTSRCTCDGPMVTHVLQPMDVKCPIGSCWNHVGEEVGVGFSFMLFHWESGMDS